jgi:hypothetical protein
MLGKIALRVSARLGGSPYSVPTIHEYLTFRVLSTKVGEKVPKYSQKLTKNRCLENKKVVGRVTGIGP